MKNVVLLKVSIWEFAIQDQGKGKVHKPVKNNCPSLCPILLPIGTPTFGLALILNSKTLTENEYTVYHSFSQVKLVNVTLET